MPQANTVTSTMRTITAQAVELSKEHDRLRDTPLYL